MKLRKASSKELAVQVATEASDECEADAFAELSNKFPSSMWLDITMKMGSICRDDLSYFRVGDDGTEFMVEVDSDKEQRDWYGRRTKCRGLRNGYSCRRDEYWADLRWPFALSFALATSHSWRGLRIVQVARPLELS
jgi:hypothetical protein